VRSMRACISGRPTIMVMCAASSRLIWPSFWRRALPLRRLELLHELNRLGRQLKAVYARLLPLDIPSEELVALVLRRRMERARSYDSRVAVCVVPTGGSDRDVLVVARLRPVGVVDGRSRKQISIAWWSVISSFFPFMVT
jgi:hypothetical protein